MKYIKMFLALILLSYLLSNFSCKKNDDPVATTPNEITIAEKTCKNISSANNNYQLCFDSLTNESRCPINAMCIWGGYATAKFSLSYNGKLENFYLSTIVLGNLRSDTTINGLYIKLKDITPQNGVSNYSSTIKKAVVEVK